MTTAIDHGSYAGAALSPVTSALRAMFGTDDLPGLARGLVVTDETGWTPATALVGGTRMPDLLAAAARRWRGTPHACAALAWKSYSYWLALPAILGWASARRVPLLDPEQVLLHFEEHGPPLTIGLRHSTAVAVLPGDPLILAHQPGTRVVTDEVELLAVLRATLIEAHLAPMLAAVQREVRIGTRALLGSVAAGIAHGILRAADILPGSSVRTIDTLLDALGLADLIDLVPGPTGEPTVQRRTCCLAFTLPQPKVCAGCCVRPR